MQIERVLVSDPLDAVVIDILTAAGVVVDIHTGLSEDRLVELIPKYDGLLVRSGTQVTEKVIRSGTKLRVIGRAGVGVDNIHVPSATSQGVLVVNSPAGNTIAACELTCGLILGLSRHVAQSCSKLKNGTWDRKSFTGNEVYGKTLAIIGLGRIGREVGVRMRAFGMRTIGYDPFVTAEQSAGFGIESLPLEQIWPQADYITLHVPVLDSTRHMLNQETLSRCKSGFRVVNVARGGIIDESALLSVLQSGHCAGAGLDVYEEEPPAKDSPLIRHEKVLCTPHLGASTKEAQVRVAEDVAHQLIQLKNGATRVHGAVNPQVLK